MSDSDYGPAGDEGLTDEEKRYLLRLARRTLEACVSRRDRPEAEKAALPGANRKACCFVTLYVGAALRGCIGGIRADMPLYRAVQECSIGAATCDPRFSPVTPDELPRLTIHISVLTPTRRLRFRDVCELPDLLIPCRHGVLLRGGWRSALYLPQVWERFMALEDPVAEFMSSLSRKAGDSSGDLWRQPGTEIEVFEALSFGEEEFDLPAALP